MQRIIVSSISGGKDSTAVMLLALLEESAERRFVFADTGNEHELTLEYLDRYLPERLGVKIEKLRADFSARIAGKRAYIAEHWERKGVPREAAERAMKILEKPFGVPSRMAQFCTQELKRYPLDDYMLWHLARGGVALESWQGVRRDESMNRRNALASEKTPEGWTIIRPIVDWTAQQTIDYVRAAGVELNPLYRLGMNRVGCMPCINCSKQELAEIARRFPQHIDRIREWERLVGEAAKRGWSTFFSDGAIEVPTGEVVHEQDPDSGEWVPRAVMRLETDEEVYRRLNVDARVMWAKTTRGGRQFDLLRAGEAPSCSSSYGLCE